MPRDDINTDRCLQRGTPTASCALCRSGRMHRSAPQKKAISHPPHISAAESPRRSDPPRLWFLAGTHFLPIVPLLRIYFNARRRNDRPQGRQNRWLKNHAQMGAPDIPGSDAFRTSVREAAASLRRSLPVIPSRGRGGGRGIASYASQVHGHCLLPRRRPKRRTPLPIRRFIWTLF
jgi:hypothetical protein